MGLSVALSFFLGKKRNFLSDSRKVLKKQHEKVLYQGLNHIPQSGPFLVVMNHYTRSGLSVIWAVLAVSAALPAALLWLMTSAWTNRQPGWDALRERITKKIFHRLADMYGFITAPPMPPVDAELQERAASVRRLMEVLRHNMDTILCLAPEGRDFPGGVLGSPPPGTGRLVLQAAKYLQRVLPVGVYAQEGVLVVHFGAHYTLADMLPADASDQEISARLMGSIAALLPANLRGIYQPEKGKLQ
jgi:1-acyl-sn-glycerol-3-phosphate acyltransferase